MLAWSAEAGSVLVEPAASVLEVGLMRGELEDSVLAVDLALAAALVVADKVGVAEDQGKAEPDKVGDAVDNQVAKAAVVVVLAGKAAARDLAVAELQEDNRVALVQVAAEEVKAVALAPADKVEVDLVDVAVAVVLVAVSGHKVEGN